MFHVEHLDHVQTRDEGDRRTFLGGWSRPFYYGKYVHAPRAPLKQRADGT